MDHIDRNDDEQRLYFAIRSTILLFIFWIISKSISVANINFETEVQFIIIDGLIRAVFALLAILVFGKIIGANGFKFAFTTKGFKKGMFAHIVMILPTLAVPFIVLSIPDAYLVFSNVTPWLLPMVIFDIGNAVWEDVLWNGVLMTGMLITWSATWGESSTVKKRVAFMLICRFAFGMVHIGGGILHALSAAVFGIIMGAAYIYSKNLLACFIVHAVLNYILRSVFVMFYDTELAGLFVQRFFITNIALGVIAIPFAIYLTVKAEPFWTLEKK